MGVYRLVLAIMVLLSHTGILIGGFNEGVVAVVQFFLLSGFVMTALVGRYYTSLDHYGPFLIDRAARIGPQFYLWLGITAAVIAICRPPSQNDVVIDTIGVIANALIIPLDFYMYLIPNKIYMPQTWSLGLELLFYISFPFLLFFRLRLLAALLSLPVFLVAVSGAINTDIFGYRLLPGTLFMFMLGSFIYEVRSSPAPTWLWTTWAVVASLLVTVLSVPTLDLPYSKEVALGLAVGLPLTWLLRHQPSGRWDSLAGNLSYGVFMSHNAVIFFAQSRGADVSKPAWAAAIVVTCLGFAYLSYTAVEAPFIRLRRSMRDRQAAIFLQA